MAGRGGSYREPIGGGSGGTFSVITRGGLRGSAMSGRPEGGNDDGTTPTQKSDLLIVAGSLVKASRAKEEMD